MFIHKFRELIFFRWKKIRLVALSPEQSEASTLKPPEINIDIIEPGNRGNAEKYASDFNCATITHELLHFLGLCDEYQEDPRNTAESQCRALGPKESPVVIAQVIAMTLVG